MRIAEIIKAQFLPLIFALVMLTNTRVQQLSEVRVLVEKQQPRGVRNELPLERGSFMGKMVYELLDLRDWVEFQQ